jgi:SpoVK/Ycf46/Vps4 family AAA+-type ATPase
MSTQIEKLRRVVQENIRVQRGGAEAIGYVDVSKALEDIVTRQNHVIFGRRGCGKTLLLDAAAKKSDLTFESSMSTARTTNSIHFRMS